MLPIIKNNYKKNIKNKNNNDTESSRNNNDSIKRV